MSDVAEVKEAIELWEHSEYPNHPWTLTVVDAARRWVLVEALSEKIDNILAQDDADIALDDALGLLIEVRVAAVGVEKETL